MEWNLQNYKDYGFGLWAVVLEETAELIGDCGMKKVKEYPDEKNSISYAYAISVKNGKN